MVALKRSVLALAVLLGIAAIAVANPLPGPVPDDLTIIYNDLRWAWASPCDGGCSMPLPTYQEGWRYATDSEWAARPTPWDFLRIPGDINSLRVASPYFDPIYSHADWYDAIGGYVTSQPTGDNYESWFVKDLNGQIPEPSLLLLFATGLGALGLAGRRGKR